MPRSASDTATALARFGTATVHEALGRHGLMRGMRLLVGPAFAGQAITVALPAGDNLGIHAALSDAKPGTVLCIASGGQGNYGVIGDLIAAAAAKRGLAAMVIDDGIRDIRQLNAPPSIAARGVSALGTVKRRIISLGKDIAIGGVLVRPGDWIVGDADGVCVIPPERLSRLLEAAAAREAKEDTIRTELARGRTTVDVLGLAGLIGKRS
jgi:4-hydroxy-4-methyl-2-oxoglutarate aldolase